MPSNMGLALQHQNETVWLFTNGIVNTEYFVFTFWSSVMNIPIGDNPIFLLILCIFSITRINKSTYSPPINARKHLSTEELSCKFALCSVQLKLPLLALCSSCMGNLSMSVSKSTEIIAIPDVCFDPKLTMKHLLIDFNCWNEDFQFKYLITMFWVKITESLKSLYYLSILI